MKTSFYLVVNAFGATRTTKTAPAVGPSEVAIFCNMELPNQLFQRPSITATIVVPEDKAQRYTIDAETQNNVLDAIQRTTGLHVKLTVEPA